MEMEYEEKLKSVEDKHATTIQGIEGEQSQKLMLQVSKYHELEKELKDNEERNDKIVLEEQERHVTEYVFLYF